MFVDAAQLAPHRPLPPAADFVAWSGHKMYAPFGAGVLIGPAAFTEGDPFLAGGGAVDLVDLDEVTWTDPPEREEAGSPNVVGAVALDAAIDELDRIGWTRSNPTTSSSPAGCAPGSAPSPASPCSGPDSTADAADRHLQRRRRAPRPRRRPAQRRVRHRRPPRLLLRPPLSPAPAPPHREEVDAYRDAVETGDRRQHTRRGAGQRRPLHHRADIDRFLAAVTTIAAGAPAPVAYVQDAPTGDYWPDDATAGWTADDRSLGASCARG